MILAFGDCELDDELYALRRRGRPVKLEPKVFDVLLFLARRRARVVTKDELLDALWTGEAVSESVLPRCIAAARRAVGDRRARGAVIQTLHRRGYRFVAPVTEKRAALPPATPARAREPFVGREKPFAALCSALEAAGSGQLRVALVAGEPGIGKTRLLAELGQAAAARGMRWLEGRCYEGEGAPAFWPWVQVLREIVSASPPPVLVADLGAGAADVAELLPELRRKLPRLPRPDDLGSDQARFRMFESVAAFLARAATRQPIAVAIDDLHWGDGDSLRLFDFVARSRGPAPVLLVGAYRDVEVRRDRPLAQLLGVLAGRSQVERLELRGLGPDAVSALISAVAEHPSPELCAALAERTAGNPFFVHELVRLLAAEGRLDAPAEALAGLALPQGVRDAVGQRLDRLSAECNAVLRTAAVAGRSFDLHLLEPLSELPRAVLLERLAEAQSAGIVVASPDRVGRFSFHHALLQQALYDELSMPRRVALHRRAGEALAERYAGRADAPAAEIAHHCFEASAAGGAARAVAWCERAADQALRLCAFDDGARHLARALEALDHGEADPARRCALLIRLGEARWAAGDRETGRTHLAEAADSARALGRADLFARAAVGYRGVGEMGLPPDAKTLALLEEARERLEADTPALRARVLAHLAGTPPYSLSMATRQALAREAWEQAWRSGDREAIADAFGARYWAALGPDGIDDRLALAGEARAYAERMGDRVLSAVAAEIEVGVHLVRGDGEAADRALERFVHCAEELRQPVFRMLAASALASRAIGRGEFDTADHHLAEMVDHARGAVSYVGAVEAGQRLWIAFQRGDLLDAGPDLLAAGVELARRHTGPHAYAGLLRVLEILAAADLERRQHLAALSAENFDRVERDEHWIVVMGLLAIAVVRSGDRSVGQALYAKLRPHRHLMLSHDLMRSVVGSMESALGALALLCDRAGDAVVHFEAAQARERAMGLRPAMVRSGLGLAASLRLRGAPGDRERAEGVAAEVRAEAEQLRMRVSNPI